MELGIKYNPRGTLTPNFDMSRISWLRVGGAAEYLFQPADEEDLAAFLAALPEDVPLMPIGMGSNMIIRDGGLRGVAIKLGRGFNGITQLGSDQVIAGAAALDAHVARKAADWGIDLTFLRTIPGAIGGAMRMNAGCYGSYLADVFTAAVLITRNGQRVEIGPEEIDFHYRNSTVPEGAVITSVTLKAPNGAPEVLHQKMEDALQKRAETQPVKDLSCGSTFRNPAGYSSTGQADDTHELKAWKVIEDAGMRGATLGGAQMSEMHPNFLINTGNATAHDLESLGELVRKKVYENSQITLEWEIMRVGEPK
ncbi:MAG: UDP-N-acetylmuramate dehydrogenase [Pseudomonadota bacterium]